MIHCFEVQAWSVEAGAAGDDDVPDALTFILAQREAIESAARKPRGVRLKDLHARGRGRKAAEPVERARVDGAVTRSRSRVEHGVSMRDSRDARHAAKEPTRPCILQHAFGEIDEGCVDVVLRHGGGNAIQVGPGHHY